MTLITRILAFVFGSPSRTAPAQRPVERWRQLGVCATCLEHGGSGVRFITRADRCQTCNSSAVEIIGGLSPDKVRAARRLAETKAHARASAANTAVH